MKYPQSINVCFRDGQRQLRLNSWVGWGGERTHGILSFSRLAPSLLAPNQKSKILSLSRSGG